MFENLDKVRKKPKVVNESNDFNKKQVKTFRVTDYERDVISEAAYINDLTFSSYVARVSTSHARKVFKREYGVDPFTEDGMKYLLGDDYEEYVRG